MRYFELVCGDYVNGVLVDSGLDIGICADHFPTLEEVTEVWGCDLEMYGHDAFLEINEITEEDAYLFYDAEDIEETYGMI